MTLIQSSSNKQFKMLKSLNSRKHRYKQGLYLIEGIRIIEQALNEEVEIAAIFVNSHIKDDLKILNIINLVDEKNIEVSILEKNLFEELSDTVNSQGLIALMYLKNVDIEKLLNTDISKVLVLDRIQDPGNLGTMIRTADAAGFEFIVMNKGTVDPYNQKVIRSTMGSIFQIPIYQSDNLLETLNYMIDKGYEIFATALDGAKYYDEIYFPKKTAIVIGNEGNGIDDSILDITTQNIKIPMEGKTESLNASVAASIVMYEVYRQERFSVRRTENGKL